ncbi:MAG: hypothetical protein COB17_04985 [Sulfurimonas sp.]|nr:MAG: hypothetical protein COB17_04985 [Sulfurimonas sp.]
MQKLLKWFAPLLSIGVAIFIIFFLVSINTNNRSINLEPLAHNNEVIVKKQNNVWLNHFSKAEKIGYHYPVNEVFIQVDLDEKIVAKTIYKLSASLLDPYQLFCLKEELKQHKLRYFFKKDKLSVDLLIYSENINRLNSLVQSLKNYQITAKVSLFKEDK